MSDNLQLYSWLLASFDPCCKKLLHAILTSDADYNSFVKWTLQHDPATLSELKRSFASAKDMNQILEDLLHIDGSIVNRSFRQFLLAFVYSQCAAFGADFGLAAGKAALVFPSPNGARNKPLPPHQQDQTRAPPAPAQTTVAVLKPASLLHTPIAATPGTCSTANTCDVPSNTPAAQMREYDVTSPAVDACPAAGASESPALGDSAGAGPSAGQQPTSWDQKAHAVPTRQTVGRAAEHAVSSTPGAAEQNSQSRALQSTAHSAWKAGGATQLNSSAAALQSHLECNTNSTAGMVSRQLEDRRNTGKGLHTSAMSSVQQSDSRNSKVSVGGGARRVTPQAVVGPTVCGAQKGTVGDAWPALGAERAAGSKKPSAAWGGKVSSAMNGTNHVTSSDTAWPSLQTSTHTKAPPSQQASQTLSKQLPGAHATVSAAWAKNMPTSSGPWGRNHTRSEAPSQPSSQTTPGLTSDWPEITSATQHSAGGATHDIDTGQGNIQRPKGGWAARASLVNDSSGGGQKHAARRVTSQAVSVSTVATGNGVQENNTGAASIPGSWGRQHLFSTTMHVTGNERVQDLDKPTLVGSHGTEVSDMTTLSLRSSDFREAVRSLSVDSEQANQSGRVERCTVLEASSRLASDTPDQQKDASKPASNPASELQPSSAALVHSTGNEKPQRKATSKTAATVGDAAQGTPAVKSNELSDLQARKRAVALPASVSNGDAAGAASTRASKLSAAGAGAAGEKAGVLPAAAQRLAKLHGQMLAQGQVASVLDELQLLLQLLVLTEETNGSDQKGNGVAANHGVVVMEQAHPSWQDPDEMLKPKSVISSVRVAIRYAAKVLSLSSKLLLASGAPFMSALLDCPTLCTHAPQLAGALRKALLTSSRSQLQLDKAYDNVANPMSSFIGLLGSSATRAGPMQGDQQRNNNREQCRDLFINLMRQAGAVMHSTPVADSKTAHDPVYSLVKAGAEDLLKLLWPDNMPFFAELFTAAVVNAAATGETMVSGTMLADIAERNPLKMSHLSQRMQGQQRRASAVRSSSSSHSRPPSSHMRAPHPAREVARTAVGRASQFPAVQHVYVLFLEACDSYRLNVNLLRCMLARLKSLWAPYMGGSSLTGTSAYFGERVLAMCTLSMYLSYLTFAMGGAELVPSQQQDVFDSGLYDGSHPLDIRQQLMVSLKTRSLSVILPAAVHYLWFLPTQPQVLEWPYFRYLWGWLLSLRSAPCLQPTHEGFALQALCLRSLLDEAVSILSSVLPIDLYDLGDLPDSCWVDSTQVLASLEASCAWIDSRYLQLCCPALDECRRRLQSATAEAGLQVVAAGGGSGQAGMRPRKITAVPNVGSKLLNTEIPEAVRKVLDADCDVGLVELQQSFLAQYSGEEAVVKTRDVVTWVSDVLALNGLQAGLRHGTQAAVKAGIGVLRKHADAIAATYQLPISPEMVRFPLMSKFESVVARCTTSAIQTAMAVVEKDITLSASKAMPPLLPSTVPKSAIATAAAIAAQSAMKTAASRLLEQAPGAVREYLLQALEVIIKDCIKAANCVPHALGTPLMHNSHGAEQNPVLITTPRPDLQSNSPLLMHRSGPCTSRSSDGSVILSDTPQAQVPTQEGVGTHVSSTHEQYNTKSQNWLIGRPSAEVQHLETPREPVAGELQQEGLDASPPDITPSKHLPGLGAPFAATPASAASLRTPLSSRTLLAHPSPVPGMLDPPPWVACSPKLAALQKRLTQAAQKTKPQAPGLVELATQASPPVAACKPDAETGVLALSIAPYDAATSTATQAAVEHQDKPTNATSSSAPYSEAASLADAGELGQHQGSSVCTLLPSDSWTGSGRPATNQHRDQSMAVTGLLCTQDGADGSKAKLISDRSVAMTPSLLSQDGMGSSKAMFHADHSSAMEPSLLSQDDIGHKTAIRDSEHRQQELPTDAASPQHIGDGTASSNTQQDTSASDAAQGPILLPAVQKSFSSTLGHGDSRLPSVSPWTEANTATSPPPPAGVAGVSTGTPWVQSPYADSVDSGLTGHKQGSPNSRMPAQVRLDFSHVSDAPVQIESGGIKNSASVGLARDCGGRHTGLHQKTGWLEGQKDINIAQHMEGADEVVDTAQVQQTLDCLAHTLAAALCEGDGGLARSVAALQSAAALFASMQKVHARRQAQQQQQDCSASRTLLSPWKSSATTTLAVSGVEAVLGDSPAAVIQAGVCVETVSCPVLQVGVYARRGDSATAPAVGERQLNGECLEAHNLAAIVNQQIGVDPHVRSSNAAGDASCTWRTTPCVYCVPPGVGGVTEQAGQWLAVVSACAAQTWSTSPSTVRITEHILEDVIAGVSQQNSKDSGASVEQAVSNSSTMNHEHVPAMDNYVPIDSCLYQEMSRNPCCDEGCASLEASESWYKLLSLLVAVQVSVQFLYSVHVPCRSYQDAVPEWKLPVAFMKTLNHAVLLAARLRAEGVLFCIRKWLQALTIGPVAWE